NRLENEADQVSQQAIATLFDHEKDPINLIKIKELLECLERATDKAEDVANVLETVVLTFDFLNGFHDAANSIATVVSTRVLSPKLAVLWAAFFNFVAAFLLGTA